jgi:hypothetical protein
LLIWIHSAWIVQRLLSTVLLCSVVHHVLVSSMVASAGETDRDMAATQFTKNCVAYNIVEFQTF